MPSLGPGKFTFNGLCDSLDKMEFGDKYLGFVGQKKKNPFSSISPSRHSTNLAKAIDNYFVKFDEKINTDISKLLYSNGFVSVLIYIYKVLIVFLEKKPTDAELDSFLNVLCASYNALNEEEASQIKKTLTSEGAKNQYRNSLIAYLQSRYNKNFGAGFIKDQPSLGKNIQKLELEFNRFVFRFLETELEKEWFDNDNYYSDRKSRERYKKSAKKKKLHIWEVMNFNSVVQEIVARNNLWEMFFEEMFSPYGIKSQDELKVFAAKIWDYRSNETGHERETIIIYSSEELNIIKNFYKTFKKLVAQEEKKLLDKLA